MINFRSKIAKLISLISLVAITACTFSYSFTGASIPANAQTFSVEQIQNVATYVAPILSTTLTSALEDRLSQRTRLSQVRENGDLAFSGEITNYTSVATAVTDETAALNRLTITVKIRFTNKLDESANFEQNFSAYEDYDATLLLQTVESTLITEIVDQLVDDIFNASVSNW